MPDEEGSVYEARPLGFPPDWPEQRGWQGFDFREDGKFFYFTFAANDPRVELDGSWELRHRTRASPPTLGAPAVVRAVRGRIR